MVIRREKLLNWAALLTIVALLIQMLPSTAWAAGLTFDNDDGTYTYEVNSDDTITITNFEPDPGITEIEIPDEIDSKAVTYIGKDAFAENQLTEVTLSTGVKVIGERAFFSNQLTKVTIPASVTSIEEFAFADNQLTEVAIPTGVKGISLYAFAWNQLTKATIPASVTSIGEGAFIDNQLTEVILSAGVASIGDRAFSGNQLTVVTIPSSVTSIGFDAFANNQTNAADLIIYGNKGSAAETYANNKNHTFRAAEYTVTYIGNGSTGGTVPTDNNIYAEGQAVTVIDNTGNLVKSGYTFVGWNTQADGKGTSYAVGATFTMGDSDVTLYAMWTADTFNNADGTYTYEVNSDDTITITSFDPNNAVTEIEIPAVIEGKAVTHIGDYAFRGNELTEVAFPASVTSIGEGAFVNNQLTEVAIPTGVTSIGEIAFISNRLTEVAIPDSVTSIGNNAFTGNQLTEVIIPASVTSIEVGVFAGNRLTEVAIPASVTSIGYSAFAVNEITKVTIPASVTSIRYRAFADNQLTEVAIPASVTNIEDDVFANNQTNAADLIIYGYKGSAVETYANNNNHTFRAAKYTVTYNGNGSTGGTVPTDNNIYAEGQAVTVIDNTGNLVKSGYTFAGWNTQADGKGTSYAVGATFTMGDSDVTLYAMWTADTFNNADGTYTYEVNSDDTITITSFDPNNAVTEIEIPAVIEGKAVTTIGGGAFISNRLTEVAIPASVTNIGDDVFADNQTNAADLIIYGHKGSAAETYANNNYHTFRAAQYTVTYNGNGSTGGTVPTDNNIYAEGQAVTVIDNTGNLVKSGYTFVGWNTQADGKGTGYVADATFTMGDSDVTLYAMWTAGTFNNADGTYTYEVNSDDTITITDFNPNSAVTEIEIPAEIDGKAVTHIGDHAFRGNELTEVAFPASVTSIGEGAFVNNQLTEVAIPTGVTSISNYAFATNQLTEVTIPTGVTSIGGFAFAWNQLTHVIIPTGVTSIGNYAFSENQLTKVAIPTGVTSISDYAFAGNQLGEVIIPANVTHIGEGAFVGNQLTEVAIPTGVTRIGDRAFAGNELREVTIPVSVTSIGDEAFANNQTNAADLIIYGYKGSAAETYANNNNHTFRAIYTVTYNGNGSTGGTVPTDNNIYADGQTVTVIDNTGNLVKSGFTFAGWNTQADGKGMSYAAGATFTMADSDVTLYAKWTAISSGGSGGSGGSYIPTPPNNETKPKDGNVTLPAGVAGTGNLNDTIIIDIPAGATKQELRLTIQKVGDTQKLLTDEDVLVSDIYEVLKNFPENFDKAVKLSIVFDPSKLASDQTTAVFYYDEAKQEWIKIEGGVVVGDRITVEVDHLNKFAVFAVDKQNEVSPSFSDITGHWAEANIQALVNKGILSGYPNGTFLPDHHITRAEFVTMLVKALGLEADKGKVFADTAHHWAKDAIAIAEAHGIVSGYNETAFGADDYIIREQMAVMIARAMNLQVNRAAMDFIDSADISSWAVDAISAAFQAGIIKGFPDHSFKPQSNTSRAEAATVLYKALFH